MKRKVPSGQLSLWQEEPQTVVASPVDHQPIIQPDYSLSVEELAVFRYEDVCKKNVYDLMRRMWLFEWIEAHDCPTRYLNYSEPSGYHYSEFWPISKERFRQSIHCSTYLSLYCLFVHCARLSLTQCLKDAIARGELQGVSESPEEGDDE